MLVVRRGINCDWLRILYGCALLLSVAVHMLEFTKLWCSVDTGDYYIVIVAVVNGHMLSCMGGPAVHLKCGIHKGLI
jgi:predicted butyrate kinase (DUF1464 family)